MRDGVFVFRKKSLSRRSHGSAVSRVFDGRRRTQWCKPVSLRKGSRRRIRANLSEVVRSRSEGVCVRERGRERREERGEMAWCSIINGNFNNASVSFRADHTLSPVNDSTSTSCRVRLNRGTISHDFNCRCIITSTAHTRNNRGTRNEGRQRFSRISVRGEYYVRCHRRE